MPKLSIPLVLLLALPLAAQIAILQIRVVDGDGAVHLPGSRSARALTVEITDETGRPIEGAAVSFLLPEEGPGGVFANGLHTEVAVTDAAGQATLRGLQWNRTPGRFGIRIVASREQARAGTISYQYIAPGSGSAARAPAARAPEAPVRAGLHPAATAPTAPAARSKARWVVLAAVAAGGAVAAGFLAAKQGTSTPTGAAVSAPVLSLGTPTVTVGKP